MQEEIISEQKVANLKAELFEAQIDSDIEIEETVISLSNNLTLKKYLLKTGFYAGINQYSPGSGHISFYEDNLVIISSRGMLAYKKINTGYNVNFKKIKNNINNYIGLSQFEKGRNFSLKDLFIFKNKIFISYTEEIKEDCWNISVIYGDMNYENIKFTKLFSPKIVFIQKIILIKNFLVDNQEVELFLLMIIIYYYQLATLYQDILPKIKTA